MNRHWLSINALIVICTLPVLQGCRKQAVHGLADAGGVLVPLAEDIPYRDVDYTPVQRVSRTYEVGADTIPASVAQAKGYLRRPHDYRLRSTSILVGDDYSIQQISSDRLLVLESSKNELYDFDRASGEVVFVATMGEGPGELSRSQDLAVLGDSAYVARADRKISVFDCHQSPCSYVRDFAVESKITAVTTVDGSIIVVHGRPNIPQTTDVSASLGLSEAATILDMNGNRVGGFGETYDVHGHWMLVRDFVESIDLEYAAGSKRYVVSSRRFPDVHVFDLDGNREKTFRVADFTIGHQTYTAAEGRLSVDMKAYSDISDITAIERAQVVAEVTTRRKRAAQQNTPWEVSLDYYLLNVTTGATDYLGRLDHAAAADAHRLSILPALVVIDKAGELFLLDNG